MLLTQAARDLHANVATRWDRLVVWLGASSQAAPVKKSIDGLHAHWLEVDHGPLSDTQEVCGAFLELETAESTARDHGYTPPPEHGQRRNEACGVAATLGGNAAQEVETAVQGTALGSLTAPQGKSWCQRLDAPSAICGKDGLESWFLWALGLGGVAVAGGVGYAVYRAGKVALPFAVAAYVPGALPAVLAHERGDSVKPHVLEALAKEGARRRA